MNRKRGRRVFFPLLGLKLRSRPVEAVFDAIRQLGSFELRSWVRTPTLGLWFCFYLYFTVFPICAAADWNTYINSFTSIKELNFAVSTLKLWCFIKTEFNVSKISQTHILFAREHWKDIACLSWQISKKSKNIPLPLHKVHENAKAKHPQVWLQTKAGKATEDYSTVQQRPKEKRGVNTDIEG